MKRLTAALAAFAFLTLGAGMARADHYDRYHSSRYNHHNHHGSYDRCDRGYYETPRYVVGYTEYRSCAPVCVAPPRVVTYYDAPRVGVAVATPGFSFYYRK